MRPRKLATVAAGLTVLLAAACASSDSGSTDTSPAAPKASGAALTLKGVCPDTIVIQTDWFTESEYGGIYRLLGPGYTVDTKGKLLRGPLVASGQDTGVQVEIRNGGPAIGYQTVSSQMYADRSITLGQVNTDEAIALSKSQPTLAVVAPLEISPLMILWDKKAHPDFNTIADIGKTDTKILYYQTNTYPQFLIGAGLVQASQLDGSYDGTPTRFVTSRGTVAETGFATSEPYILKHELPAGKSYDTGLQLINDTGYPFYSEALSIRPEDKGKLAPCLKKLVPIVQQASVDFIGDPGPTNELVLSTVQKMRDAWTYSPGMAAYAVKTLKDLGLVGNGPDKTLGNTQDSRIQRMIEILTPIYARQHKEIKAGLTPADLYTNEYINSGIGLPASSK